MSKMVEFHDYIWNQNESTNMPGICLYIGEKDVDISEMWENKATFAPGFCSVNQ